NASMIDACTRQQSLIFCTIGCPCSQSSVLSPSVITSVSPVAMTTVLYFFATSFAMSGSFSSNALSGLVVLSNTPPNTDISPALAQIADNSTVESMSSITFVLKVVAPTAIGSNKTG